jgi:hypothetical protein
VDLAHAVEGGDPLHGLAQELVGDHAVAALLVRHEHLERAHAQLHGLGQSVEDCGLVVENEVEAEVEDRLALRLLAQPPRGPRQRLARRVVHEGHDAGESGARGGLGGDLPVVVLRTHVQVAVDQARKHQLAGGIDDAIGGRQPLIGRERDDAAALDRDAGVDDVARGDHPSALDDEVDGLHRFGSLSVTGCSKTL